MRTVSSQILPPLPNLPPSRTAKLAPHPMILVLVCSTQTWISTSTSLWASWTRMRKGYLTMKSSFPRLHLQLPTHSYGPPARTNTQTYLCSSSSSPSARLLTHESGSRP